MNKAQIRIEKVRLDALKKLLPEVVLIGNVNHNANHNANQKNKKKTKQRAAASSKPRSKA